MVKYNNKKQFVMKCLVCMSNWKKKIALQIWKMGEDNFVIHSFLIISLNLCIQIRTSLVSGNNSFITCRVRSGVEKLLLK